MIKILLRLIMVGAVGVFFLMLYRPDFVAKAGNALLTGNNSKVTGSAQLLPNLENKGSSLQVSLQGLVSRLHYVVTLNQGSCGGKVLATLGSVTADQQGNVVTTLEKANLDSSLLQGAWINVHKDSASGTTVACGRIQTNSAVATAQSNYTPTPINPLSSKVTPSSKNSTNTSGFPKTGVAPAKDDSYNNHTFPRKY